MSQKKIREARRAARAAGPRKLKGTYEYLEGEMVLILRSSGVNTWKGFHSPQEMIGFIDTHVRPGDLKQGVYNAYTQSAPQLNNPKPVEPHKH